MSEKRRNRVSANTRGAQRDPDGARRATLSRALSKLGYCSRTQAETLIREGRVTVAGRVVKDTETWVDLDVARIAVDGKTIVAEQFVYLMLNKPRGLVTTRHDPEGRATVFDRLKEFDHLHLSPVGRLDKASEGLLLFTNDTKFANALLDPETHVGKTYHVQADRLVGEQEIAALIEGLEDEGDVLRARKASVLRAGDKTCWLEIELDEGKNRQIRRMLEALGIGTLRLVRVAIGSLLLGDLDKGTARPLSGDELEALRREIGKPTSRRG